MPLQKTGNAFVQPHDPDDETDYTFRFRLSEDEGIASAAVIVIDPVTCEPPDPASDMILTNVSFGMMSGDQTNPGIWGVTVWVSGGTPSKSYYIQCQITTDSSPLPRILTKTMRLLCAEQ